MLKFHPIFTAKFWVRKVFASMFSTTRTSPLTTVLPLARLLPLFSFAFAFSLSQCGSKRHWTWYQTSIFDWNQHELTPFHVSYVGCQQINEVGIRYVGPTLWKSVSTKVSALLLRHRWCCSVLSFLWSAVQQGVVCAHVQSWLVSTSVSMFCSCFHIRFVSI